MNYDLDYFLEKERNGTIYCKIAKSSKEVEGLGEGFPYRDYVGKMIYLKDNHTLTFESLDEAIKYLHYGDDLVIFSFEQGNDKMPCGWQSAPERKDKCFTTSCIFVKEVKSFKEVSTIDFAYNNLFDKNNFYDNSTKMLGRLNKYGFEKAALRCKELADGKKSCNKEIVMEEPKEQKGLLDCLRRWFRKAL